jgi:GT2 family glycosyltransferase
MASVPRVLVGLISHNRFDYTRDALAHVFRTRLPFDMLVVDCGSEVETKKRVFDLTHETGGRFVSIENRNCNGARDIINHYGLYYDYVVYVDNDALPPSGWLDDIVDAALSTGAALVGVPQSGTADDAPMFLGTFETPHQDLIVFKEWAEPLTEVRRVDWVTGNCMAVRGSFLRSVWEKHRLWERWKKFPIDLDDIDLAMMAKALGEAVVATPIVVPQNRAPLDNRASDSYRLDRDDFHNYALSCVSFWSEWRRNPLLNWNSGYTATNYKPGRIYDASLAREFRGLVDMLREHAPGIYETLRRKLVDN